MNRKEKKIARYFVNSFIHELGGSVQSMSDLVSEGKIKKGHVLEKREVDIIKNYCSRMLWIVDSFRKINRDDFNNVTFKVDCTGTAQCISWEDTFGKAENK